MEQHPIQNDSSESIKHLSLAIRIDLTEQRLRRERDKYMQTWAELEELRRRENMLDIGNTAGGVDG